MFGGLCYSGETISTRLHTEGWEEEMTMMKPTHLKFDNTSYCERLSLSMSDISEILLADDILRV